MKKSLTSRRIWFLCLLFVLLCAPSTILASGVTFYTDEQEWLEQVGQLEVFALNSQNISLSDEVTIPPAPNTEVGSILTFQSANTGLSRSFQLRTLSVDTVFGYNTPNFVNYSTTDELLDVGTWHGRYGIDDKDDWDLQVLSGTSLFAFAFDLVGNDNNADESFNVYGPDGSLLGSVIPPWDGSYMSNPQGTNFLGVIADSPIARLYFNEDLSTDEIAIANLRFATPEPTTLLLLALGGLILRRRKS